MYINGNPTSNLPIISFQLPKKVAVNSQDSISKETRIKEIASDQLGQLIWKRYKQPQSSWPEAFPNAEFDCEGLTHYLLTGKIGKFEESEHPQINKVDLNKKHNPYTGYKLWHPNQLWDREEFWGPVHYFTHLQDGKYLSKNGGDTVRIFNSFEEMLRKDAFPFGWVTEDGLITNDIKQAVIGESMIGFPKET